MFYVELTQETFFILNVVFVDFITATHSVDRLICKMLESFRETLLTLSFLSICSLSSRLI